MSRSEPLERADVSQTAPATADRPTFASASNCGGGALSAAFFHHAAPAGFPEIGRGRSQKTSLTN